MSEFESYDDGVLMKISKYDKNGYIIYNLLTDLYVEINGEDITVDVYSHYYTILNRNVKKYYNAEFEEIYAVDLGNK